MSQNVTIISSQRHLNEEIIESHMGGDDFTVSLSPVFEFEGGRYQVVLDGHHRLEAARRNGVEPEFVELTAIDHDDIHTLNRGETREFLESVWMDSDYYDINTGRDIW